MLTVVTVVFTASFLVGVPIAFCFGLAGGAYILFWEALPPGLLVRRMYYALDSFPLLAVPLFIMVGDLAERAGLIPRLVAWLKILVGWMRGGIAYMNVISMTIFSGISGTAIADLASLGRIMLGMMQKAGYDRGFSCALTAATSMLGPIIPPSVAFIIYALAVGNISIVGMFLAGALPGLVMALALLAWAWYKTRNDTQIEVYPRPSLREIGASTVQVLPILVLPLIIIVGITGGVVTVTESAAIAVIYVLVIGFLFTRELRLRDIYQSTLYAATTSAVLGMLMGTGAIISWILTRNQATALLADFVASVSGDPVVYMLISFAALTIIGTVMEATPMIIALAPLMAPVAAKLGIPDIQFGLVFCMTVLVGMITPPVGLILFLTCTLGNISLERLSWAILPFCILESVVILAVILFPPLTLWLPRSLGF
ncbi:MAG: TRAP transporter large permease [Alphaproteobacteria bacterium]|nr:TRAP transporter large permease [Alphaproteobacteria bacterium]